MSSYNYIKTDNHPIMAWTKGVPVGDEALEQLHNIATLPFIHSHIAVMPDVHWGMGATVGSVIAARKAIIPAAVGVDIGCGMMAVKTSLTSRQLPDNLQQLRSNIEQAVPHGRTGTGRPDTDEGAWSDVPERVARKWMNKPYRQGTLKQGYDEIYARNPKLGKANSVHHLGTLGSGNHFIEICLDEQDRIWAMLHSGSRGIGGRIGKYFIEMAKRDMERFFISLPDKNLAYFPEGTDHFSDYIKAVSWAQAFARLNRELMMDAVLAEMGKLFENFSVTDMAINCHHNYVAEETHFGKKVWLTRKGAVSARKDQLGIIPGSMGAKSFIVKGKGNAQSFCSCSHGAGRKMSRAQAVKQFSVADHERATKGVECRKDKGVIDETPMAYKDIDQVMAAEDDLVEIVHTLKQVVCVKG